MAQFRKICEFCGKEYIASRSNSKVCSDTCRVGKYFRKKDTMSEDEIADIKSLNEKNKPAVPIEPIEYTYIREYMGWDGKSLKKKDIMSLVKRIEDDNEAGRYSINGEFGEQIKHIHIELNKLLKRVKSYPVSFKLDEMDRDILGDDIYLYFS